MFISSSGSSESTIDQIIFSRDLRLFITASTSLDLYGSDHFPVSIIISDISPSSFCHSHKLKLSKTQFFSLHYRLSTDLSKYSSLSSSPSSLPSPLSDYDLFYSFLKGSIASLLSSGFSFEEETYSSRLPAP